MQSVAGGEGIARRLGDIVLRNHGLPTVGATVQEAVVRFLMMEHVAEAHFRVRSRWFISHDGVLFAKAGLAIERQACSVFDFLVRYHLGEQP